MQKSTRNKEFDYCVFIISHGRANKVKTYKTLRKHGYTGKIIIVVDNLDEQKDEYIKNFINVYVYDKLKDIELGVVDTMDNFKKTKTAVYVRNALFDIAKELGYRYFIVADDDYESFDFVFDNEGRYVDKPIKNLDRVFDIVWEFYRNTPNILTVAFAQGGDFIGGSKSSRAKTITILRKAMNLFFCDTERRFTFLGTLNEDVNAYVYHGRVGKLFFTINFLRLNQCMTQTNSGGLTDIYLDLGTYVKSFYTVMISPASVKITEMGYIYYRLHHNIDWNKTVPKIISEEWVKK